MKEQKQNRILGRHLARELTADELGSVSGGTSKQYSVRTNVGPGGDRETRFEFD